MRRTLTRSEADHVHRLLNADGGADSVSAWAAAWLAEIADGARPASVVEHPLGFLCIKVYRSPQWGVCLHIWPATSSTAGPIHSHTWDLTSHVLCGHVENRRFSVVDEPATATHRIVEITRRGGWDLIQPTRRLVGQSCDDTAVIGSGTVYRLPAGAFHTSRARGLTVTVLLAHNRPRSPELVLWPLDMTARSVRRRSAEAGVVRTSAAAAGRAIRNTL